ncbi:lytic transglycosylase domain-containing protein [Calorimonas adulescens]|uniref:Lytic transglycosylase domain-containing protein n=1 Tax=Calorimonas adulescens TaxID=2606906 RepID=A0A5D8QCS7_9THEO|nr:lytic transglycosylase domain-containing protein [Calorimonas adulescens]
MWGYIPLIFIPRKWIGVIIAVLLFLLLILVSLKVYNTVQKMIYPTKYMDIVERYAVEYGIDPYLVLAVIKAESNFNPEAKSSKGAIGLMQIQPDTGKWIAENLGIENYNEDLLYNPEVNIRFGCWYINNLNSEFKDPVLVFAAYNAGRGNVQKWLNDKEYSDDGEKLKSIPFKETRDYVDKIIRNYHIFTRLYEGKRKKGIT